MFIVCVLLVQPSESRAAQATVRAYNCDRPQKIEQFDARMNCTIDELGNRSGPTTAQFTLVQQADVLRIPGHACRVEVHRHLAYCGVWSYQKTLSDSEHEVAIASQQCLQMIRTQSYELNGQRHPLTVPGLTYIRSQDLGIEVEKDGYPTCEGANVQQRGHAYKGVVQHSRYRVVITKEMFEVTLSKIDVLAAEPAPATRK